MSDPESKTANQVSGQSARRAAEVFNYGNILGILIPVPVGLLWLGISMVVYAMNRHHPNEKVGHYTQQAAYRFYGVTGCFVAVAMFLPPGFLFYGVAWALGVLVLVPWSIIDLRRIRRDCWEDCEYDEEMH